MARIRIIFRPWPRIFVAAPFERAATRKLAFLSTLGAVLWIPISGAAFLLYSTKHGPPEYSVAGGAYFLWGVHVAIAVFAILCWAFEQPRMKQSARRP